jgi:putative methyltransferase (TIGR04325 family)
VHILTVKGALYRLLRHFRYGRLIGERAQLGLIDSLHRRVEALAHAPLTRGIADRQAREAFIANRDQNMFLGVYGTWAEAEAAAKAYGTAGYNNLASADMYRHRVRMDAHDYPALYWLMRSLDEGMTSVFDVGGSIGIKYLAFREPLSRWPALRWRVQDVRAVAEHGRELARERGDSPGLEFTHEFKEGDGIDVLFASGVVQYLPETLGGLLAGFTQLPRRIVINTAAIHPQHEFFTVNSIGTAFCPYRIQTQGGLMRGLTALGYKLRETWFNVGKPMRIPHRDDYSIKDYSGYCLDRVR